MVDAWKIALLMKFYIYIYDNIFCMENQGNFFFLAVSKIGNGGAAGLDSVISCGSSVRLHDD